MLDIYYTVPYSWTITIKQNVWFQVGICPEKFQLDKIQNGQLAAIITFNMPDIWQTMPDSWTITIKQNVRFQGGIWFNRMHKNVYGRRINVDI